MKKLSTIFPMGENSLGREIYNSPSKIRKIFIAFVFVFLTGFAFGQIKETVPLKNEVKSVPANATKQSKEKQVNLFKHNEFKTNENLKKNQSLPNPGKQPSKDNSLKNSENARLGIHALVERQSQVKTSDNNAAQKFTDSERPSEKVKANQNQVSNQTPYDGLKNKREDVSKRDLYSKTYVNADGSYTALIGAGPIHYEKNGVLDESNNEITSSSQKTEFKEITNLDIQKGATDTYENGFAKAEQSTVSPSSSKNIEINIDAPVTNALPPRGVIFTGGNFNFQFPPLTSSATISAWGAGGAGGGVNNSDGAKAGGGGGGGAFAQSVITVGNGTIYSGVAGVGGNGNGPDSNWNTNAILAKGGIAGGVGSIIMNGTGGAGGSALNSTGTIKFSGGDGAAGSRNGRYSGGGGGSAGQGSVGGNASDFTGGTAGTGTPAGAAGANGRDNNNGAGYNGTIPGSGGSGAYRRNGINTPAGGNGANGQVLINYEGYCRPLSASNATYINALSTTNGVVNILKTNTGYGAYGYQNFYYDPNGTVSAPAGGTFDLSFTLVTGGTGWNNAAGVAIWIDWNQDGVFDATERIVTSNGYLNSGTYNVVDGITVPAAQATGDYVMRIVTDYWSGNPDSCNLSNSVPRGEGEDYKLTVLASVSCDPVTATADKYSVCSGDTVTLTASSTTSGYTYTWYTDWDNDTHTGTYVGTGSSINVNPTESILYGVVATKTGCPTGVNAAYALITIAVTPPPTLIVPNPVETIACTNEFKRIDVSGGVIPPEALFEDFDPIKNPWISSAAVSGGGNVDDAQWHLYASGGGVSSPDNSNFAGVNSAAVGPYQMVSSLNSPPISLLDYDAPINLTFNHYYRTDNYYPLYYSTATVEISTDGGLNWNILRTYTGSDVGGPTSFASETVNLNAYAGNPYVLLRFNYEGRFDWYWLIDDIIITGVPLPTNFEWTPYAGLYLDGTGTVSYNGENVQTVYASPSSTTTYTVNSSTAVGCPSQTTVTVRRGDKNWISPASTDWNIAANWNEGGIPTADHCVRIPNTSHKPIIDGTTAAFAKNVIIADGGGLTIEGGGSLTVTDYFNHLGTGNEADVVIRHNGNLIQINDVANTGEITVEKDFKFSAERKQYNYVTAPVVSGRDMKTSIYTPNPTSVQVYNTGNDYFYETAGPYVSGLAYAVKESPGSGTDTVAGKLMGVPFNGPLNYTLNTSGNKYNLLGNPYPSNLDIKALYDNNNTKIESTFYFWDNTGNTLHEQQGSGYEGDHYAKYNAGSDTGIAADCTVYGTGCNKVPDRNVKVGTGFMIEAISGTLNFTNAYRTTAGSIDFFGKPADFDNQYNRYWLTLTSPSGIQTMMAVVYFDGGTDEFSADDTEGSGGSNGLYSILDTKKLNIQGRAPFRIEDQVPLGYKSFEAGTYIIEVYNSDGIFAASQNIYLIDKLLNKTVKITDKPYKFLTRAGQFNDRFVIVYRPGNIIGTAAEISNQILFAKIDNQIVITSTIDKIAEVELFNLNSRSVYKKSDVNSNELRIDALNFNHQIVVVTVKTETGEFVTRKFVNN